MNFTVYSKNGCPFCEKIESVLKAANFEHQVYKLDSDFTREQFYDKFGQGKTFPQVLLGEENLGGCMDTISYLLGKGLIKV